MFLRKFARNPAVIGWLIAAFLFSSNQAAQASQTILYSAFDSSGCKSEYGGTYLNAQRVVATSAVTINTIRVLVGTRDTSAFSTSKFYLMSNNPTGGSSSNGAPNTSLGLFSAGVISGSSANTSATFTNAGVAISAGTIFWIVPGQRASVFPYCYWSSSNTSLFNQNGVSMDTSTTNSTTSWHRAYILNGTNPIGASWTVGGNDATAWQFALEYNLSEPVNASVATQSGLNTATYRKTNNLQATVDTDSKVTFYANDKVIAGCRNLLSSGGTATCPWKPSVIGATRIFVKAVPVSSSYTNGTSSYVYVGVSNRTDKR